MLIAGLTRFGICHRDQVCIPLEEWVQRVFEVLNDYKNDKVEQIDQIISKTIMCNPIIALTFINVFFPKYKPSIDPRKFKDQKFHEKIFSLWLKNRKEYGEVEDDFENLKKDLRAVFYIAGK